MSIQSQNLNRFVLREIAGFSEAEILLRKIPHDHSAGHVDFICEKIKSGQAKVFAILEQDEKVGVLVWEIYGRRLHILAVLTQKKISIEKTIWPQIKSHAALNECDSIGFDTVRAGLVALGLSQGFYISSVVMRCTL